MDSFVWVDIFQNVKNATNGLAKEQSTRFYSSKSLEPKMLNELTKDTTKTESMKVRSSEKSVFMAKTSLMMLPFSVENVEPNIIRYSYSGKMLEHDLFKILRCER